MSVSIASWGHADNVAHAAHTQFPHNYNIVSRESMYQFVNQHLNLGLDEPIAERPYRRLSQQELSVWNDDHPAPPADDGFEQRLLDQVNQSTRNELAALRPRDAASLKTYREVVGGGWNVILRDLPQEPKVEFEVESKKSLHDFTITTGLLSYRTLQDHQAELPVVVVKPTNRAASRSVLWVSDSGKDTLFERDGTPTPSVRKLLAAGRTVVGVDLLYQGEFLTDAQGNPKQRSIPGEEGFGDWTYCYNLPLFLHRVHDLLATFRWLKATDPNRAIEVVCLDAAAPLAVAALVQHGHHIDRAAIDTRAFGSQH